MKSYTDLEQSKKLAKILPIESADMHYWRKDQILGVGHSKEMQEGFESKGIDYTPCWSLAALLKYLSEIKTQVYTPVLFPSEDKWILQFVGYGHGNVCEVSYDNPIDACYETIVKLNELIKML